IVNTGRAAGDNQPFAAGKLAGGSLAGPDVRIDSQFSDLTCDQVAILTPGIEYRDLGRFSWGLPIRHFERRRCTITRLADSSSALALGRESIAFSTMGSVSTVIRRASSALKAVMYISRRRKRLIQSLFSANSASVNWKASF